jgi:hypothetical protein
MLHVLTSCRLRLSRLRECSGPLAATDIHGKTLALARLAACSIQDSLASRFATAGRSCRSQPRKSQSAMNSVQKGRQGRVLRRRSRAAIWLWCAERNRSARRSLVFCES